MWVSASFSSRVHHRRRSIPVITSTVDLPALLIVIDISVFLSSSLRNSACPVIYGATSAGIPLQGSPSGSGLLLLALTGCSDCNDHIDGTMLAPDGTAGKFINVSWSSDYILPQTGYVYDPLSVTYGAQEGNLIYVGNLPLPPARSSFACGGLALVLFLSLRRAGTAGAVSNG